MNLKHSLRSAILSIGANKLRTALTTLGIIIGVASVIVMLALGNGARAAVQQKFRELGADEIQIYEKLDFTDEGLKPVGKILSYEDGLLMAEQMEGIKRVDMMTSGSARVRRGRNMLDMSYSGVNAQMLQSMLSKGSLQPVDWPDGAPLTAEAFIERGRFFTPVEVLEAANMCVLGYQTALDLFNGDDPLEQTVWVNRKPYTVIGVLKELESIDPEKRYRETNNDSLLIPISTAIRTQYETEPSVSIQVYLKDEKQIDAVKTRVIDFLRKRHNVEKDEKGNYKDDFSLASRKDILGAQQEAARTFSLLLAAMATVSLVVGGIGIMNVMLVSVTERTREIGIRLAVGAQRHDILQQFLLEAVLISAGGGLAGITLGILAIPLAAKLNQGMALLSPDSIPLSFSVALLTGVIFGLYPALHAANLRPIDALRYE